MENKLIREKKISLIAGWPHVALTRVQFAELMLQDCIGAHDKTERIPKLAFSMNGQALSLAETNADFGMAMKKADYIQADGQSLVFASRLLSGNPLPERIATTDFFHDAAKVAEENGLRFYLLGAKKEVINKAVENIKKMYPELVVAGYRDGYFKKEDEAAICREIVNLKTDVLWIGLGKPSEQYFCLRNKDNLKGVGWVKTCGGLFDFLAGKNKRAPLFMQKLGLEWLFRLALEPKRLFYRYFTSNFHFFWLVIKNRK